MEMYERTSVIEVNFLNGYVYLISDSISELIPNKKAKKVRIDKTLTDRFLAEVVPDFWHDETKDKLEVFQYFNTGHYFCQRSKKVYDFASETSYWKTYNFTGATSEQAKEMKDLMIDFHEFSVIIKNIKVKDKIEAVSKEAVFFEDKYLKMIRQKNELLQSSDWRILPDIVDKYEGEKDRWMAWRAKIREITNKGPGHYENYLEFFKAYFDFKYPIDPAIYREKYPNDMLEDGVTPAPAFLDETDPNQWVGHDVEASKDFYRSRELSIYNMADSYRASKKKVKQSVLDIMKLIGVEDVVPVDWSEYYVHDSELEDA